MSPKAEETDNLALQRIAPLIHEIRGERVILDSDLATIYGVETRVLNQAVKRNPKRFPADFVSQLMKDESEALRSRSQSVTLKRGHNIKYAPYAFTEHGAIIAANVLNGEQAVEMSVFGLSAQRGRVIAAGEHSEPAGK